MIKKNQVEQNIKEFQEKEIYNELKNIGGQYYTPLKNKVQYYIFKLSDFILINLRLSYSTIKL